MATLRRMPVAIARSSPAWSPFARRAATKIITPLSEPASPRRTHTSSTDRPNAYAPQTARRTGSCPAPGTAAGWSARPASGSSCRRRARRSAGRAVLSRGARPRTPWTSVAEQAAKRAPALTSYVCAAQLSNFHHRRGLIAQRCLKSTPTTRPPRPSTPAAAAALPGMAACPKCKGPPVLEGEASRGGAARWGRSCSASCAAAAATRSTTARPAAR